MIRAPIASPATRMLSSAPNTRPSTSSRHRALHERHTRDVHQRVSDAEDAHQQHRRQHGRPDADQREAGTDQDEADPEVGGEPLAGPTNANVTPTPISPPMPTAALRKPRPESPMSSSSSAVTTMRTRSAPATTV